RTERRSGPAGIARVASGAEGSPTGRAPRGSGRGAALPGAKLGGGAGSPASGRRRRRSSWLISLPWLGPCCRSMYCAAAERRRRRSGADRGLGRLRGRRVLGGSRLAAHVVQVLVLGGPGQSAGRLLALDVAPLGRTL